jgi:NADH-quinone oxidoreductase subunit M
LVLLILPFIASALSLLFKDKFLKIFALAFTVIQLGFNSILLSGFDKASGIFQYMSSYIWFTGLGLNFSTGIDGIAMVMLLLTNLASMLIVLTAFDAEQGKKPSYFALILFMQGALNGVFLSMNGLMFYVFWELALIPIYLICGIWGSGDKIKITFKFFIYTFLGSLLMLLALIYVYLHTPGEHSFEWHQMLKAQLTGNESTLVLWAFFIAFAIKMPVFPFHTWQADTYTSAPTQGTMLLSGIMLKMGIFGMIRWMWPFAKQACSCNTNIFIILAVIGIVYAAIIAMRQNDIKRVIAWSSVSHVGLIAAGVMTWTATGLQGGVLQMFNHGINIIGLFLAADIIERRIKTRELNAMGGLAESGRGFAFLFMVIMLGSVAVPLTNGFTGELLLLNATFNYQAVIGVVAGLTVIFCAVYMMRVYQLAMFGTAVNSENKIGRLTWSEYTALGIIVFIVLLTGIFPNLILDISKSSVSSLLTLLTGNISQ